MSINEIQPLVLARLALGIPGITSAFGECLAEAAAVCLEDQGHQSGVNLAVSGVCDALYSIDSPTVTDQMRRCWNDHEVTTEHGAYAVAILLAMDVTDGTVVERSRKGTGFDFWLGPEDALPFEKKARLEVSGIRTGGQYVERRVREKVRQMGRSNTNLPGYATVIEFGTPRARMEK